MALATQRKRAGGQLQILFFNFFFVFACMCALHLSFSETNVKNVAHRIKIIDTPEELGR